MSLGNKEKPLSRQRRWQLKQVGEGRCMRCGLKPIDRWDRCKDCYKKTHTAQVNARKVRRQEDEIKSQEVETEASRSETSSEESEKL